MDELDETEVPTAGERLRAAREGKGLSLEEVAAQTRIPRRHLESLETADWEKLPAPTYTIGFAKSYASAVDLDRNEIGDQLRAEMGGTRATATTAEVFEPADPARTMPKWLVLAAVAAVILVIAVMTWLNNRSLNDDNSSAPAAAASDQPAPAQQQAPQPAVAQGPVVLSATQAVWLSVKDNGHILKQGTLQPGETYTVPSGATAPMLTTAKAEALKIAVGTTTAAPVGPAATRVTVSLLPADLMKGGTAQTAAPAPTTAAAPASQPTRTRHAAPPARRTTAPPPAAVTPAPVPAAAAPATANTAQ